MIRIAHVLCPVDFSEFSVRAVHHAAAIAHWYGARLTLVNVFPVMPVLDLPPLVLEDEERAKLIAALRHLTAGMPPDTAVDLQVEQAPLIHEAIVERIATTGVDLLVIGSHGRSGFQRLLLGSMAERLIRLAPCPTMVVPAQASDVAPDAPVRFRHILCPVDFSDASLRALEYALSLAEEADARLRILHVMYVPPELSDYPVSLDRLRETVEADRVQRLSALVPADAADYCTIETALREGVVHHEILRAAREGATDLIVMGAQGRGAIEAAILGSNTARVARAARCPLLVVTGKQGTP